VFADSLPVFGKDGTLANVLSDTAAAGKVQVNTGDRVVGTQANQYIAASSASPNGSGL
jgi:hypothetical protein